MTPAIKADWDRVELRSMLDSIGSARFIGCINSKVIDSERGHAVLNDYFKEQDRPVGVVGFCLRAFCGPAVA